MAANKMPLTSLPTDNDVIYVWKSTSRPSVPTPYPVSVSCFELVSSPLPILSARSTNDNKTELRLCSLVCINVGSRVRRIFTQALADRGGRTQYGSSLARRMNRFLDFWVLVKKKTSCVPVRISTRSPSLGACNYYIPVTAFLQTDLFLVWIYFELRPPQEPNTSTHVVFNWLHHFTGRLKRKTATFFLA